MDHVLTLIAAPGDLTLEHTAAVRAALRTIAADTGSPDWLAEGEAADIPFGAIGPDLAHAAARRALGDAAVDAIAQPIALRRKRLLVADMDSTIITSETLDELAAFAGLKDKIAAITRRSMNGELDFAEALRLRVGMLKGLATDALERTWEATALTPGAAILVATMRADGAFCCLASGGFTFFTGRVAAQLAFDMHVSNTLLEDDGKLTGEVSEPIFDRDAKLTTLKRLAAEQGLPLAATLAVGDGANDLAMIQAAGLGVAFRAKPIVAAAARARVDHGDLCALLFAQGFRRAEFVV
jgi:phosphoserine phosphatase